MKNIFLNAVGVIGLLIFHFNSISQVIDISKIKNKPIITGQVKALFTDSLIPKDQVIQGDYNSQFRSLENDLFVFKGYNTENYWFRFIINNPTDTLQQAIFSLGPTGIKEGELFQLHNGTCKSLGKTGYSFAFLERPYQFMHYAYPLQVGAHSTDTFYLTTNYYYAYKTYGFALEEPHTFKAFENKVYFFFGIIIGLLLLFLVFNLFVYVSLKERVHFWYAVYIAVLIMVVLKNDQLDDQFLGTDSENGYRMFFLMGIGSLAIGVLMHVVQLYLRNIKKKHGLYKISLLIKWNVIFSSLLQLFVYYFTADIRFMDFLFHWTDISATVGVIMIIINCIYSAINGFRSALFILTGLCGFLFGALQKLLLIPTESLLFPPSTFHIGMVMEVIIISFGFIYSYRQERRESRNMERNFMDEMQKAKEEIQEQTFKTISQEIHDNIGQVLTLAKLTINTIDSNNSKETKEKIQNSGQLLSQAIQDLRNLSRSLNAEMIMEMGLINAIDYEMDLLKNTGTFKIELDVIGSEWRMDNQIELILFRIFQEVVTNIMKHARANKISVFVNNQPNQFVMKISDDGIGFKVKDILQNKKSGMGIRNIQNRTKVIGAQYSLESYPNKGTTVIINMDNIEMYME